jgi:uncharacterized protein DUF6932
VIDKEEFPPLLGPGFYIKSMAELRAMCVDAFPLSKKRPSIMAGLERFVDVLRGDGIVGDLWVDGSFTTEKIDPCDVDVVLRVDSLVYDNATVKQRQTIDMIAVEDLKKDFSCDAYVFFEYPKGDPLFNLGDWDRAYWIRQYGFNRGAERKGIVVLELR